MLSTALILFTAGLLTVLLPCILPLLPVVLGISIAGRSKWRPLFTVLGMIVSFVGFTFLLQVVLMQFVQVADYIRLATYAALFLFGVGFLTGDRRVRAVAGAFAGLFFLSKGPVAVLSAMVAGVVTAEIGSRVAGKLQQLGSDVQQGTLQTLGRDHPLTAFIIGLTLGLVWVPCAGPALGFALTLVRESPGIEALFLLTCYALGTAVPLLIVGYGGQWALHSARSLTRVSGRIKQIAGALLVASAIAFHTGLFMDLQTWFVEHTGYGTLGTQIEERLFDEEETTPITQDGSLPVLSTAPELASPGPWFNGTAVTMESLKGTVVLVDFWTYSCINCIRTLPYVQGYWDKYKGTGKFALLGVHTPEFAFEAVPENVRAAIAKHKLTYPVVMDNTFGTWKAFSNRYWPAKYLIDAEGRVRYVHFGEGNYEETDKAIAALLGEIGVSVGVSASVSSAVPIAVQQKTPPADFRGQTPETYLGSRSWSAHGNANGGPREGVVTYAAPSSTAVHKYYLVGDWELMDDERQTLRSDFGEIRIRFLGSEINLVMGSEGLGKTDADVQVDGSRPRPFKIEGTDLYPLWNGEYGEHELILRVRGKGAEAYAFTFGS